MLSRKKQSANTALKKLPIYARPRHFRKLVSERGRIGPKEVPWAGSYRGPKGAKKYFEAIDVSADGQRFLIPRPDPANADACHQPNHCGPQLGWHAEQEVMSILMSFSI